MVSKFGGGGAEKGVQGGGPTLTPLTHPPTPGQGEAPRLLSPPLFFFWGGGVSCVTPHLNPAPAPLCPKGPPQKLSSHPPPPRTGGLLGQFLGSLWVPPLGFIFFGGGQAPGVQIGKAGGGRALHGGGQEGPPCPPPKHIN